VEAARRAQIVTLVNRAATEAELGELVTAELCEAFEAEIAFVLAQGEDGHPGIVGAYGLRAHEAERLPAHGVLDRSIDIPQLFEGPDLLSVGAKALVLAPFSSATARGVVGVARLHDEGFDEAEAALLEAVAASTAHALERLRLAEECDRLYREAHEQAQAARVIGSIADGVVLVDDAGVVQLWNPAAEAITGLGHGAVIDRPLREAIPGWAAVADSLGAASDPASSSARATMLPVDVAGREIWLSIRAVRLAEGTVYAFHDLTEERRLEQLKADFIATVSHELRTPLAAVHGAAKTLLRNDVDLEDEVSRQLLGLVSEQSDRLARLVEDILLASSLESPELELATEHVDVAELAADAIDAVRVQASEQLTLDLTVAPSLPPVAADRDKLRQVLVNLVANAVKYSPAGGRIAVEAWADDGQVRIAVRDQGLGISPSEQGLIFEKFYRADANMTRGVSGSGLGLYISRALVSRMGGTISVESQLGAGSAFVVRLPLAPPEPRAG
jgi:two-component system, OmpR family, phosphate regulon sensor histidine kinase PhoR